MLTIVGIGTGDRGSISVLGYETLKGAKHLILQTGEVPVACELKEQGVAFETLDGCYQAARNFDELVRLAMEEVKRGPEEAVLGIMGNPQSNLLAKRIAQTCESRVIAGMSFADEALCAYGAKMEDGPVFCCPASELEASGFCADTPVVVFEIDTPMRAADVVLYLLRYYPPEFPACLVKGSASRQLTLKEVMSIDEWDYSCCLALDKPKLAQKQSYSFADLCGIIGRLRGKGGCPWDAKQTHESLRPHLLEESYEVIDAIDDHDPFALADELGDVLLQVVMHATIGEEHADFDIGTITDNITRKMIHRHAHIFGEDHCETPDEVLTNWERIKREEKGEKTRVEAMEKLPGSMSSLLRAAKIQKKAAYTGFDWEDYRGAYEKVEEELGELNEEIKQSGDLEDEAGDLLFAVVNLLRLLKVDGDTALNRACKKFIRRFGYMESHAGEMGKDLAELSVKEQDKLWQQAKKSEKNGK